MTGPLLVRNLDELDKAVPFDLEGANLYFNGYSSRYMSYESAIRQNGWLVIYYNEGNHTVWAYGEDFGDSQYHVVRESEHAQSKADFINKLSIALKEANETEYWLMLLNQTDYITDNEFDSIITNCKELLRLLISIIKTTKENG